MSYIYLPQDNLSFAIALDILGKLNNPIFKNIPTQKVALTHSVYKVDRETILRIIEVFLYHGLISKAVVNMKCTATNKKKVTILTKKDVEVVKLESAVFEEPFKMLANNLIPKSTLDEYDKIENYVLFSDKEKVNAWLQDRLNDLKDGRVHDSTLNFNKQISKVFDNIIAFLKHNTASNVDTDSLNQIDLNVICYPLIMYELQQAGLLRVKYISEYQIINHNHFMNLNMEIYQPNTVSYDPETKTLNFNNYINFRFDKRKDELLTELFKNPTKELCHQKLEDIVNNQLASPNRDRTWQQVAKRILETLSMDYPSLNDFLNVSSIKYTAINPKYLKSLDHDTKTN